MAALIHMHKFPLETEYAAVIGYVKRLVNMWKDVRKITTDETGIGDVVTEDMRNEGLRQTVGIGLNIQTKTDIMENLRNMLVKKELKLPYDQELIGEMNAEKFELNKTGQIQFSHPSGTHDDQLWALALACHGLKKNQESLSIIRSCLQATSSSRGYHILLSEKSRGNGTHCTIKPPDFAWRAVPDDP